jgi:hypothetical protein
MSDHPYPIGTPVRHYSQQWARLATATITAIEGPLRDGSYEYQVLAAADFSRPLGPENSASRLTWWSSLATRAATEEPS